MHARMHAPTAADASLLTSLRSYHASRESFTYLREFYIGELWPEERQKIPMEEEKASDDFMTQLRDFASAFRLSEESQLAFVKAHLGA